MDRNGRLFDVPYVLSVASGKGGAGKTTVAASLAFAAQQAGLRTAVLDLDFHGPSLAALLSLPALGVTEQGRIVPHELAGGPRALSLGQLLEPTAPVEWRGAAVEGFLLFLGARVALDDVDLVVLDLPPGTGEVERAAVKHLRPDAVLLVTTGSSLSHADCRRAAAFFHASRVPLLGVVENLSRRLVPIPGGADVEVRLFGAAGDSERFTAALAATVGELPYLGSLPFEADPRRLAASPDLALTLELLLKATTTAASGRPR
jgi:ATP-binding protein involved in chromosome partitioning